MLNRKRGRAYAYLVLGVGAFVVPVFAASIGTPVEGKIGTYTAEWTLEN
jgi:hypothetical protein